MKQQQVLVVAPHDEDGGIGKYTTRLLDNMEIAPDRQTVHPEEPDVSQVARACKRVLLGGYDSVHLQHLYFGSAGLFSLPLLLACTLARSMGTNIYVTAHEVWGASERNPPLQLLKTAYVWTFHALVTMATTTVLFLSSPASNAWYGPEPSSERIPHGVPTNVPERSKTEARDYLGLEDGMYVVLPGFINDRKNHELFAEVAAHMKDVNFVVAGGLRSTRYKSHIEMLEESSSNIEITGVLDDRKFHAWFDAADVVVLPYKEIWQSGIYNNCAAHRVPVLASNIRYFSSLNQRYNTPRLFDAGNVEDCRTELESLIEDKSELNRLHQNMEKYADRCSFDKITQQKVELYEQ